MSGSKKRKINREAPPADDTDLDAGAPDLEGDGDTITVDKAYLKKLRSEAANRRVQTRDLLASFENYSDQEVEWMLETAELLITDPPKAVARYKELVNLYDPDSKEAPSEDHPKNKKEDEGMPEELKRPDKVNGKMDQLTREEMLALLEENKKELEAAQRGRELKRMAESKGYTDDHPGLDQFLALMRKNQGDVDAADQQYRELIAKESERLTKEKAELNDGFPGRGRSSGPPMPKGDAPKTLEEAAEATNAWFASLPGD